MKIESQKINILVTGAGGFVGRKVVPMLLSEGHSVKAVTTSKLGFSGVDMLRVSRLDSVTEDHFKGIDAVVHLAAIAHTRKANHKSQYREVNYLLPKRFASFARDAGCRKFVFISTAKVHGAKTELPIDSDAPYNPTDDYSFYKVKAEEALLELNSTMEAIVLRPPVVYGPEPKANIKTMLRIASTNKPMILSNSDNLRSFISIDNLCSCISSALANHNSVSSGGYLVHDGQSIALSDFFNLLVNATQSTSKKIFVPEKAIKALDRCLFTLRGSRYLEPLYSEFAIDCGKFEREFFWRPVETTKAGVDKMCKG